LKNRLPPPTDPEKKRWPWGKKDSGKKKLTTYKKKPGGLVEGGGVKSNKCGVTVDTKKEFNKKKWC